MPTTVEKIKDPEILKQAALLLEAENKKLFRMNLDLRQTISQLRGDAPEQMALIVEELNRRLKAYGRDRHGDKSERRKRQEPAEQEPKKQKGHGSTDQPELPVFVEAHELDEPDQVCSHCGGRLAVFEGQTEDSEEVDVLERRFIVVKHKRQKYRCACGACIETAEGPPKLIPGGRYSVDFAVAVAIAKYADHLPLERQATMMGREGLKVSSQTLWDQIDALARHLQPAYDRLHDLLLREPVLGADETPWKLLGHRGRRSKRWYAWSVVGPPGVVYRVDESRSAEAAKKILKDFEGTLLCDGYTAYSALQKERPTLQIAHCWAHARRKFFEIKEEYPEECGTFLDLIGQLYAVEKQARAGPMEERLRLRNETSRDLVKQIREYAFSIQALPQSSLGKAVGYLFSMWKGLIVFLEDPRLDIDNNGVERSMRALVVGRKNHYGSKSQRGTEVAALFYSLIETAKLNGLNPETFLRLAALCAIERASIQLPHEIARSIADD